MQRRLFHVELPLHAGWEAIEPLRASVLACVNAVFPQPALARTIALVTTELLENAVKFGRWDAAGGGVFALRLDGTEDRVEIEESVYLAGTDGPRRTTQIVIYGHARKVSRVQWTFSFTAASPVGITRRGRAEEPQLPL